MHLGQGKNCKYVLKTPGLNTEVSEFNTEKSLDIYIETLINNDITINGEGGFYVMTSRLEKIVSDAKKCIALQKIDPQTKS